MNTELLKALQTFVEEIKSEVSKYDESGYLNPSLEDACGNLDHLLEMEISDMEDMEPIWGVTADHAVLAREDIFAITRYDANLLIKNLVRIGYENVTLHKNGISVS